MERVRRAMPTVRRLKIGLGVCMLALVVAVVFLIGAMRPDQELKGFEKVAIDPGETRAVRFTLTRTALSFYDPAREGWVAEPGQFEIRVAASSRDIRARARFVLQGE